MIGIVLSGGKGTRLYPCTNVISKQLLPIYDKPMIYYPISTLMLVGIRDFILISSLEAIEMYKSLLRDGNQWGIRIDYVIQEKPEGIAQAFILTKELIKNQKVCLILGDNLFYGRLDFLRFAIQKQRYATIFAYEVENPQDYGVVVLDKNCKPLRIVEKPKEYLSPFAIPGVYLFDEDVSYYAEQLKPSARGELEITDLQNIYLAQDKLDVQLIGRGVAWLDTGLPSNLLDAALFIRAIEQRQGRKIACLEEIALKRKYITPEQYLDWVYSMPESNYKSYCLKIFKENYGN